MVINQICVSESYRGYETLIAELPDRYLYRGSTLYSGRNLIRRLCISQPSNDPIEIVVKAFAIPRSVKGLIYANLLTSKARRSLNNAQRLIEMGIPTPEPIACIEQLHYRCLRKSYFVCRYWHHNYDLFSILFHGVNLENTPKLLLEKLSQFTVEQHNKGILHLDYNPSNILVRLKGNTFSFALVDLNRLKFKKLGIEDRIYGLIRLTISPETMKLIGYNYAQEVGFDTEEFCLKLKERHNRFWTKRLRIEKMLKILKKTQNIISS